MTGYLVVALIDFAVSIYVLRASRSKTAVSFALLWFCFGIWSLDLFLASSVQDAAALAPWFHALRFGMFFIAPCMIVFFTQITRTRATPAIKSIIAASGLTSLWLYVSNLLQPSILTSTAEGFVTAPDLISSVHEVNFVGASLFCLVLTGSALKNAIFREKQRMRWLIAAIVIGTTLGVISFGSSKLFGMAGNVLGLSILAYALLRHHMISVGTAVHAGLVKAVSLLVLGAGYALLELGMAQTALTTYELGFLRVTALFGMLEAYPRLVLAISGLRDRYFQQPGYNYDYTTTWMLKGLKNCSSLSGLRDLCDEAMLKLIKVEDYHIDLNATRFGGPEQSGWLRIETGATGGVTSLLPPPKNNQALLSSLSDHQGIAFYDEAPEESKDGFTKARASACVPILLHGDIAGFITLGRPLKAAQFTVDDIRLLEWISSEIGPALERLTALDALENSMNEAEKTLTVVSRLNEYNHDVKTPFSNIEALLLAGDAFSPEEQQAKILEQVKKGHALVSTMARMLKGQHKKTFSRFNLNETITDVVSSFPTHAGLVTLELNEVPPFDGYEEEVGILFSNILSNAFRALNKAKSSVVVSTSFDQDRDMIVCTIKDNGAGMSEERLATLWDRSETGYRAQGGSGIGMGVIKRIVSEHGGSITAASQLGSGTEFYLSLPAAKRMKPRDAGVTGLRAVGGN
ncbi:ATP-binding protein [Kordiimonas sp.]|uniref:ATP-binding protein n=1 Tax=Kordiimonas sp. TaxID=1970157 RepID=UPI003A958895